MGYILLGHGGLDIEPRVTPEQMEFVAIPEGTTIQFYADAGQGLLYGSRHLDIWEQLRAPWPVLDSTRVTYNLVLHHARELWTDDLRDDPQFRGHTVVRPGVDGAPDPLRMCAGDRDSCPTDPRAVAAGGVHACDGVLGTCSGDLHWVACAFFARADIARRPPVRAIAPPEARPPTWGLR